MRQAPKGPRSKVSLKEQDTLCLEVELITPLFGGGVTTKQVDEVCWLRASEVKASLRFWWRALYGHQYATSEKLHQAESERFGSARGDEGQVSPVAIKVSQIKPVDTDAVRLQPGDAMAGAYFPALPGQGNSEEVRLGRPGAKARLSLSFRGLLPDQCQEVRGALVTFLVLGGIGSRTRRGAGALAPSHLESAEKIGYPTSEEKLAAWLARFGKGTTTIPGPIYSLHRKGVLLRTSNASKASAVHLTLLEHWRAFRQNRRHPMDWRGKGPWGQSRWPEGDVVRRFIRKNFSEHTPHELHTNQAPRALLGLPIVIHFKEQTRQEHHQIRHEATDRYASPIWLAVTRTWKGEEEVHHGVVVAMPSVLPFRVHLEARGRRDPLHLEPSYPNPRPERPEEPKAHAVASPGDMVFRVRDAFTNPTNHPVKSPLFLVIP